MTRFYIELIEPTHREVKKRAKVALADGQAAAITALRLKLLANGYSPIPNRDKRTLRTGWNALWPNRAEIESWLNPRAGVAFHAATGLLVVDRLVTIDNDLPDPEIAHLLRSVETTIAPQLRGALERGRDDGSPKFMLFARRDGDPFTIKSRKWSTAPEDATRPSFQIEIFASDRNRDGKALRQVGAFGPHTVDDDTGAVRINYAWKGASPAEVPLADLPILTDEQALAICAEADRILERRGYKPAKGYRGGRIEHVNLYDLDDQTFEGADFACGLEELAEIYWQNQALGVDTRCSGSFTGEGGTRQDRCIVGWSGSEKNGHLTVHDFATEITHRPKPALPESFAVELPLWLPDSFAALVKASNKGESL